MSCKKCRHWFVNPNIVIPGEPTEGKCLVSEIKTQSNQVCNAWELSRIAELEAALEHVIEVGNYGWDVIRKHGWEEKEINWWNTASDKAYKCLRKGRRER